MGLSKNWETWKTRIRGINIINKDDCIYIAGLLDGEGCIGLNLTVEGERKNYYPHVSITNTNKEVLDWVKITVGKGSVIRKPLGNIRHKQSYHWRIYGNQSIQFIKKIYPYLKIKKLQAETIMQYEKTIQLKVQRHPLPEDIKIERDRIRDILTTLNKRGNDYGNTN
jgi:hypothetical protein